MIGSVSNYSVSNLSSFNNDFQTATSKPTNFSAMPSLYGGSGAGSGGGGGSVNFSTPNFVSPTPPGGPLQRPDLNGLFAGKPSTSSGDLGKPVVGVSPLSASPSGANLDFTFTPLKGAAPGVPSVSPRPGFTAVRVVTSYPPQKDKPTGLEFTLGTSQLTQSTRGPSGNPADRFTATFTRPTPLGQGFTFTPGFRLTQDRAAGSFSFKNDFPNKSSLSLTGSVSLPFLSSNTQGKGREGANADIDLSFSTPLGKAAKLDLSATQSFSNIDFRRPSSNLTAGAVLTFQPVKDASIGAYLRGIFSTQDPTRSQFVGGVNFNFKH